MTSERSHLANERTHLSFLRTGVSLISFGVTLNRFSLYLIQSEKVKQYRGTPFLDDTKNVGIGMVILGSALLFWAMYHFLKTAKQIETLDFTPSKWSILSFTLIVAVIGTCTTVWMML
jgi:putative membrane protein